MKYTEILQRNKALGGLLQGDKFRIAIISNVTVSQLKDVLELTLRENGINAEVEIADFDSIVQESLRFSKSNAVMLFWELVNLVDGFQSKVYIQNKEEINRLKAKVESEIDIVLRNLKNVPLVLINSFSATILDNNPIAYGPLQKLADYFNNILKSGVSGNQIIVNIESIFAILGIDQSRDIRQFQTAKSLYSVDFFRKYSEAIRPAFLSSTGKAKKVLVMDCDNTLWGGIIGEDGESGLLMSDATKKGKIFKEVQTLLLGMKNDGVLLALCSKNNEEDVINVLRGHSDILITERDIVSKKINWNDKASNLIEMAKELNLGLDSFVFVDDSSFEIGLIKKELPEVEAIQVPTNLSEYPIIIKQLKSLFFSLSSTDEDKSKTAMYLQESQRKELQSKFDTIDDYLTSLGLCMKLLWNKEISVPRAAQLTQKTNQFNLTTQRYTEADIERILNDPKYEIGLIQVKDAYGDYGITGMVIIELSGREAKIENLLLSCRVIGRNIEFSFFDQLVDFLKKKDIRIIRGLYCLTAKNKQVESFYDKLGLNLIFSESGIKKYLIETDHYKMNNLPYIKID
jgi:FkbH-like protein